MKKNLIQAYRQAPWRIQLQWIGIFLLILVLVGAVAGVYLNVSAQSAAAGRQIQKIENRMEELQLEINDLATQLATIHSSTHMQERIENSDFTVLDPSNALYLVVPGYYEETDLVLAPPASSKPITPSLLKPEYSNSLWEKLMEVIRNTSNPGEVTP